MSVLDCLRQPLEAGEVVVQRSRWRASFPSKFQLVMAANPCPCGQYGTRDVACTCTPFQRRRYLGRLSGPLVDRLDLQIRVNRITSAQFRRAADGGAETVTTSEARSRVADARGRSSARLDGTPWSLNAEVPGQWLRSGERRLPPGETRTIDGALEGGRLTMRGYDRVLRIAWTLADLDGVARPTGDHVARALSLRRSL
jgi:magnesium chelatase family protein